METRGRRTKRRKTKRMRRSSRSRVRTSEPKTQTVAFFFSVFPPAVDEPDLHDGCYGNGPRQEEDVERVGSDEDLIGTGPIWVGGRSSSAAELHRRDYTSHDALRDRVPASRGWTGTPEPFRDSDPFRKCSPGFLDSFDPESQNRTWNQNQTWFQIRNQNQTWFCLTGSCVHKPDFLFL